MPSICKTQIPFGNDNKKKGLGQMRNYTSKRKALKEALYLF